MNKVKGKFVGVALATAALMGNAMAIDATAFTTSMTSSLSELDAIFAVGATIVIAFFIWGVLKKGVRSSK